MGGQHHALAALCTGKTSTHCTEDWVGLRAGLDRCGNISPPGFDPWTVLPVASRYTY
jgi:hypothetical protein